MAENEKEKTISIDELKNETKQVTVSIDEIREATLPSPEEEHNLYTDAFDEIDDLIVRKSAESKEVKDKIKLEKFNEEMDKDIIEDEENISVHPDPFEKEEDTATEEEVELEEQLTPRQAVARAAARSINKEEIKTTPVAEAIKKDDVATQSKLTDDEFDSYLEDEEEDNSEELSKKDLEDMKTVIKTKITPFKNAVDLSKFSISKKHISINRIFEEKPSHRYIADWVLPSTGIPCSMSEFSATDIEKLNPQSSGRNRLNTIKDVYRTIYDHIVDPNKPASLEVWAKSISFYDIDHLYFTVYKASFEGSNHIPYQCPDCNKVFLSEASNINTMVKYKSKKAEDYVKGLLNKDTTSDRLDEYESNLIQVSDDIVIGLRKPSIFNVAFENAILDEKFTEKYNDLLALLVYIDNMYYIDKTKNELVEIDTNPDYNNMEKTIKRRVVRYTKVIQGLTSDQYYELNAKIKDLNDKNEYMEYVLPSTICPHCSKTIEEQVKTPENLLFTRHQLAALANI